MATPTKMIPALIAGIGVLAAAALIYTLARHEVSAALIPVLIVFAIAVVAPHATH